MLSGMDWFSGRLINLCGSAFQVASTEQRIITGIVVLLQLSPTKQATIDQF